MRRALCLLVASFLGTAALAQTAPLAPVEQTALARDAFGTGLLDRDSGALGPGLWRGADARVVGGLLRELPARPASPSIGAAARRLLLSGGDAPQGADAALGGAKLNALVRLGFINEAREIESLSVGGKSDAGLLEAMATADLLAGDNAAACARVQRIAAPRDSAYGAKLRAFCYAVGGELDAADLAFGLLRERDRLTAADEDTLGPLVAGGKPKAGAEPVDAVHLAVFRYAGVPLGYWPRAEAGVLTAVATDAGASLPVRFAAARRAAAMGVMSGAALKELFSSAALDVATVATGPESFRQRPDDAVALAAAYQSARSKSAPEFARDRAALVAGVLSAARDFDTLFLAAVLFADDVKSFEGMLISNPEAEALALARLAVGDIAGAENWLAAGAVGGAGEGRATDIPALVAAAKSGAGAAKGDPARDDGARGMHEAGVLALAVDAAIEAAGERIAGQGTLAALVASQFAATGDPIAEVVVSRGLLTAGLDDLARRRTVERLLQERFARLQPPAPAPASAPNPAPSAKGQTPRLKPAPSQ
jgi:hypothetical protein